MFHSLLMKDPDYKLTKEQANKLDVLYEKLNPKQQKYTQILLEGLSPPEAKKKAGYGRDYPEKYSSKLKKYLNALNTFKVKTILSEKEKHISKLEKYINKLDYITDNTFIDLKKIGADCYIKTIKESVNAMQEIAKLKGFYVEQEIQKDNKIAELGEPSKAIIDALHNLNNSKK